MANSDGALMVICFIVVMIIIANKNEKEHIDEKPQDLGEHPKTENIITKHKLTLDKIFLINLERHPNRRREMENLFVTLDLDVDYFEAVDGKKLNKNILKESGIQQLPGYRDRYDNHQMTFDEIGCFLSHYEIWLDIIEQGYKEVFILQDNIILEANFKEQAEIVLEQARNLVEYDLIYFGRKRLKDEKEPWIAKNLVRVGYSYWTLAYVITQQGARKLIAAKPLEKLLPVDEFLPIMFNRHPNKAWSAAFKERNLTAFSAAPLLVHPAHYNNDVIEVIYTSENDISNEKLLKDEF